ncbi:MAG: glycerol-3-phosphate acyltransferase [Methanosarcinales archaeon]|nr:glycerol-3-phosphate acyltransferase [Methanosarcinales archaeon]
MFVLIFYLYGSIPFPMVATYVVKGAMIQNCRSGNVSVANAFGAGGVLTGLLAVAGEGSKVLLPLAAAGARFQGSREAALLFIAAALLGTQFSLFLRGRGGMGATVVIWTLALLAPRSGLILAGLWVALTLATEQTRYSTVGSYLAMPPVLLLVERSPGLVAFGCFAALLCVLRYDRRRDEFAHARIVERLKGLWPGT